MLWGLGTAVIGQSGAVAVPSARVRWSRERTWQHGAAHVGDTYGQHGQGTWHRWMFVARLLLNTHGHLQGRMLAPSTHTDYAALTSLAWNTRLLGEAVAYICAKNLEPEAAALGLNTCMFNACCPNHRCHTAGSPQHASAPQGTAGQLAFLPCFPGV